MAEALDPILPGRVDALAHQVLVEAGLRGLKLATAESCTGGLLASLLTDIPLHSHVFERGFVTYSNDAKQEMLGVSLTILDGPGPVSREAALAMAQGALDRSRADIALSVTGWAEAGPVPDPERPAGRVHFVCAMRNRGVSHHHAEFGDVGRAALRLLCLETSLRMMLRSMTGWP